MAKTKATIAPAAVNPKAKDAEFLRFYDKATRESLEPSFVITDCTGKPVCHLDFTSSSKWDKDTEKFVYFYKSLSVKKQVVADGEFVEIIKFVDGMNADVGAIWTMIVKPDADKAVRKAVTI